MSEWLADILNRRFQVKRARAIRIIHLLAVVTSALLFSVVTTLVMSFSTLFLDQTLATLEVGDIAPRSIFARESVSWVSDVLTQQGREQAVNNVELVYDLPDANVARQQTQLARRVLDLVQNIRRDPYGTLDQKLTDLNQITALDLDEGVQRNILEMDDDVWRSVDEQIMTVLERVFQQAIRESDLRNVIARLPNQVSVRFSMQETGVITAVVGDLVRPNTFVDFDSTEAARERIASDFQPVRRTFVAGQLVVEQGSRISAADLEALQQLGLLEDSPQQRQAQLTLSVVRAFMISIMVMIVIGLFVSRFSPSLFSQPRFLILCAVVYLLFLLGAQLLGLDSNALYLYPTSAMALLFVAIVGAEVAIVSSLGMAVMVGFMFGQRLELAVLVGVGGLIGILSLRKAERLNSYFFAGLMVALMNALVIATFNINSGQMLTSILSQAEQLRLLGYGIINGLLSATVAMALMYLVTLLFNLPTGLRLVELSQPNQPLLQRLLRDAPGTYQHSLQVANLVEQAANAIGANAELARVAALYHDIGKSVNAPFFVENQADGLNPHDDLNDPYRSAAIIISHVTEGDKLARMNRLPRRVRDFIMEHHGTTRVEYFYRQAMNHADDSESVDPAEFTYPGPIPQSRETAIMMLADSCESTVRARRPSSKQEIQDIVQGIIDARTRDGQLDESGLTANDLKTIRSVFVDMLQAVFHPRINYPSGLAPKQARSTPTSPAPSKARTGEVAKTDPKATVETAAAVTKPKKPELKPVPSAATTPPNAPRVVLDDDDAAPLPDVPPLPRNNKPSPNNEDNA